MPQVTCAPTCWKVGRRPYRRVPSELSQKDVSILQDKRKGKAFHTEGTAYVEAQRWVSAEREDTAGMRMGIIVRA